MFLLRVFENPQKFKTWGLLLYHPCCLLMSPAESNSLGGFLFSPFSQVQLVALSFSTGTQARRLTREPNPQLLHHTSNIHPWSVGYWDCCYSLIILELIRLRHQYQKLLRYCRKCCHRYQRGLESHHVQYHTIHYINNWLLCEIRVQDIYISLLSLSLAHTHETFMR